MCDFTTISLFDILCFLVVPAGPGNPLGPGGPTGPEGPAGPGEPPAKLKFNF